MHSDSLAFHVSVLRKQFAAHCRERLAGEGITLSQLYILICVGRRENISPRAISEIMGLDAGYLTRALAKLSEAGLITQEKNPRDRRAAVLNLTERGREIFDFSRRLFREWDEIALAPLSGEERQTLLNLMAKVSTRRLPGEGRPGEDRPGWMQPAEMEEDGMSKLQDFMKLLTGNFDNREQWESLRETNPDFPLARHVNTACNDKITGLPQGFSGEFMVEESYFTAKGTTHASNHLFLFTEEEGGIRLTSYEIPEGCDKSSFTYEAMKETDYSSLKPSQRFTPALYTEKDGVWEGGSVSMFSSVLKFSLFERFSKEVLEVSESMEVNGTKTFGYDVPILYRRS